MNDPEAIRPDAVQSKSDDQPRTSLVDGVGLWNSWTRSFSTPAQAFWDLMDNAFDASCPEEGQVHVDPDNYTSPNCQNSGTNAIRGLVMLNTCKHAMEPLEKIMTAYQSSKNSEQMDGHIGENGVGVKQGCATLSDLSFVLTRNEDAYNTYGLGVVAKRLQQPEGLNLPFYEFSSQTSVKASIWSLCKQHPELRSVIKDYADDGKLETGTDQLVAHYETMSDPEGPGNWGSKNYVFGLVIHKPKHRATFSSSSKQKVLMTDSLREKRNDIASRVMAMLNNIKKELPKHYLHVKQSFQVQVNGSKVSFSYWPRRLVEMTRFQFVVNTTEPLSKSTIQCEARALLNTPDPSGQCYVMDVYIGFDVEKCADDKAVKTCSLYWHSRSAGRLIKQQNDARGDLFLGTGGTTYCQGLTVIVDDCSGCLPLNPTKQDHAWSELEHGATHRDNIMAWLSVLTKVYYNHYLVESHGKKAELTKRVCEQEEVVRRNIFCSRAQILKPIQDCELTTFAGLKFSVFRSNGRLLLKSNTKDPKIQPGVDTLPFSAPSRSPPPPPPAKKRSRPTSELSPSDLARARNHALPIQPSSKRQKVAPNQYVEQREEEDGIKHSLLQNGIDGNCNGDVLLKEKQLQVRQKEKQLEKLKTLYEKLQLQTKELKEKYRKHTKHCQDVENERDTFQQENKKLRRRLRHLKRESGGHERETETSQEQSDDAEKTVEENEDLKQQVEDLKKTVDNLDYERRVVEQQSTIWKRKYENIVLEKEEEEKLEALTKMRKERSE